MKINQQLYRDYLFKDKTVLRAQYDPELEFYATIKSGNTEKAKELCLTPFTEKKGLGELADTKYEISFCHHYGYARPLLHRRRT